MGKRILKIIISHAALIFYWCYLYKVGDAISSAPIINFTSIILILIIYGLIYAEITKKGDKKLDAFIFLPHFYFLPLP